MVAEQSARLHWEVVLGCTRFLPHSFRPLKAFQPILAKLQVAMSWYQKRSKTAKNMTRSIKAELGFSQKAAKVKSKAKAKAQPKLKKAAK
jgi:hypothetical protein